MSDESQRPPAPRHPASDAIEDLAPGEESQDAVGGGHKAGEAADGDSDLLPAV